MMRMVATKLRGKTVKVPKVIEDRLLEIARTYPRDPLKVVIVKACEEAWREIDLLRQREENPNIGISAPIPNEMLLALREMDDLLEYMEKVSRGEIQFKE